MRELNEIKLIWNNLKNLKEENKSQVFHLHYTANVFLVIIG